MPDEIKFQTHSFKFDEPGDAAAYRRLKESGGVELFAIGIDADRPDHLMLKLGPLVVPIHPEIAAKLAEAIQGGLEKLAELKAEKEGKRLRRGP